MTLKPLVHELYQVTEVELVYRHPAKPCEQKILDDPQLVYKLLLDLWDENKIQLLEESKLLLLDQKKACIGVTHLASGGITSCIVDPRLVFATAIKARASSFILAHNHPSGQLKPSRADISLTRKLCEGAALLDLELLDHLIITRDGYYSMASAGYIP